MLCEHHFTYSTHSICVANMSALVQELKRINILTNSYISWNDVHALPSAAMDAMHSETCKYYEYKPCNCGVIPMPKLRDYTTAGIHWYPPMDECKKSMADELVKGPKQAKQAKQAKQESIIFTEFDPTRMDVLANIELAVSAYSPWSENYVHEDVMVHGFIYLLRVLEYFTPQTSYKLAITAMFVAMKYHCEDALQVGMFDAFVEKARVSPAVLRIWEVEFLRLIKHQLYVSPYEFYAFRHMYVDVDI